MGAEAGRLVRDKTSMGKRRCTQKKKTRRIELDVGEIDLTLDNFDLVHPKSPKVKSSPGEKVPRKKNRCWTA
jgi:hypothetical protein